MMLNFVLFFILIFIWKHYYFLASLFIKVVKLNTQSLVFVLFFIFIQRKKQHVSKMKHEVLYDTYRR